MRRKKLDHSQALITSRSLPATPISRNTNSRFISRRRLFCVFAFVVVLSAIVVFLKNNSNEAVPISKGKSTSVKTSESPVKLTPDPIVRSDETVFASKAAEIISHYGAYRISVSAHDFATSKDIQIGSKERFRAASTAKLITATDYMSKVEAGSASLDTIIGGQTARQHLKNMLVYSDNNSWNTVNEYMTLPDLTAYASKKLGIEGYDRPANMLNSDETNGILARLYSGKLLNKVDTEYLLSLMLQANYRAYIVAAVPDGFTVYHKAGFYLGNENDAAIIVRNSDGKAVALTIYSYGNDSTVASAKRTQAFSELTSAAITSYFN